MISKLMLIQSDETEPINQTLQLLEVDILIGDNLELSNWNAWRYITSIENCTLRDHWTKFTFPIIYNILLSSDESSSSLPPMSLEIAQLGQLDSLLELTGSQHENSFQTFALQSGLIIYYFGKKFSNQNKETYFMHIQLKDIARRKMILTII
ncbi:hypothetical protein FGO68_gene11813 [Halteria grandinella]|uniref:Uncharacterized protein n=1 Tax=Halteria grandinella TaxID=5974 RepID=A0A8J8NRX8_HALGN|nr:hypothetical protein FGO68_gene11813 [Halteria grandinella]